MANTSIHETLLSICCTSWARWSITEKVIVIVACEGRDARQVCYGLLNWTTRKAFFFRQIIVIADVPIVYGGIVFFISAKIERTFVQRVQVKRTTSFLHEIAKLVLVVVSCGHAETITKGRTSCIRHPSIVVEKI